MVFFGTYYFVSVLRRIFEIDSNQRKANEAMGSKVINCH